MQIEIICELKDFAESSEFNWLVAGTKIVEIFWCLRAVYWMAYFGQNRIRVRPTLTGVCPTLSVKISNLT